MLLRVAVVLLAGVALGLSWQPYGLWPLLLIGIPAFTLAVRGVRPAAAFGLGYLFGLTMLMLGCQLAACSRYLDRCAADHFHGPVLRRPGTGRDPRQPAALVAARHRLLLGAHRVRVLADSVRRLRLDPDRVRGRRHPTGRILSDHRSRRCFLRRGFDRSAHRMGAPHAVVQPGRAGERDEPISSSPLALAVSLGLLGSALRLYQVEPEVSSAGSVHVGIVQGNIPGRGIEAMGRARSVTNNHLSETIQLMTKVRLGEVAEPDFLLWPENSTDIDPTVDPLTKQTVQAAVDVAGRPILVGAVMQGPGFDERQTAALWWDPERGVMARYDKQNLVPFGEWIPFRAELLPLIPLLQKVGAQSVAGTRPGVLDVAVAGRPIKIGDVICFELAYDQTIYQSLIGGAQVLMVQSNNATYGGTGQIEQQFAITRARAMESRREIAVATTNSVSGFITRDGAVATRTQEFTAQSMVVEMPLRSALTPAIRVAPWLERGAGACCSAGLRRGAVASYPAISWSKARAPHRIARRVLRGASRPFTSRATTK